MNLLDHILHLPLKDGDMLFINAYSVNIDELMKSEWPENTPRVRVVPVLVGGNRSVRDEVFSMTKEELNAKTLQKAG